MPIKYKVVIARIAWAGWIKIGLIVTALFRQRTAIDVNQNEVINAGINFWRVGDGLNRNKKMAKTKNFN